MQLMCSDLTTPHFSSVPTDGYANRVNFGALFLTHFNSTQEKLNRLHNDQNDLHSNKNSLVLAGAPDLAFATIQQISVGQFNYIERSLISESFFRVINFLERHRAPRDTAGWVQAAISRDNADLFGRATVAICRASSPRYVTVVRSVVPQSLFVQLNVFGRVSRRVCCSFVTVSWRDLC